jgi:two-component system OmpR family response regulator
MVSQSPANRPHILCVDENHDAADSAAMVLQAFGFDAEACCDGRSALRLAEEMPPDLCIIDLNMPGMDGHELAVNLRNQAPERPVTLVAVTAMSNDAAMRRLLAAGFTAHLVKPADPVKLVDFAKGMKG